MRFVLQRVSEASVAVSGSTVGQINRGLLVLIGVEDGDTLVDAERMAKKISLLRIFPDDQDQMNRSVRDIGGEALVISQFTLLASTRKGTRPSFSGAAKPGIAGELYSEFVRLLSDAMGRPVATGRFAADMQVSLVNDGPVTIILDSNAS